MQHNCIMEKHFNCPSGKFQKYIENIIERKLKSQTAPKKEAKPKPATTEK